MRLYGQIHPHSPVCKFCCSKGQRPVTFQSDASQQFSVIGQYSHNRDVSPRKDGSLRYSIPHPFHTLPSSIIWLYLCWLSISPSIYIYWPEQKSRCHDHGPQSTFSITSMICSGIALYSLRGNLCLQVTNLLGFLGTFRYSKQIPSLRIFRSADKKKKKHYSTDKLPWLLYVS